MSKNELLTKTKKELFQICKELNLPRYKGKSELPKDVLIESIIAATEGNEEQKQDDTQQETNVVETTQEVEPVVEESVESVEEVKPEKPWEMLDKKKHIEEAEVGTLIAFYDEKGKPRTAALVNRSSSREVVKVVTEFEREFIVPYANVLWVRKGPRWPRAVYEILKGYSKNAGTKDAEE